MRCICVLVILSVGSLFACRQGGRADPGTSNQGSSTALLAAGTTDGGKASMWELDTEYSFDLRTSVTADFGNGADVVRYDLAAKVIVAVVDRNQERATLYLGLLDPVVSNRGQAGAADLDKLAQDLKGSDCLFVLSGGRMTEFGVRGGVTGPAAATCRQIATSLQVVLPEARTGWQSEEYDTTGQYVAEYTYDETSRSIAKQKLRYLALVGHPTSLTGEPLAVLPEITRSIGRIQLSTGNRLETVDLQDDIAFTQVQVPIRSSNHLVLRLASVKAKQSGLDRAKLASSFLLFAASQSDAAKAKVDSLDRARTQGASFKEILARIEADRRRLAKTRPAGGKANAPDAIGDIVLFDALAASLRLDPSAVDTAVRMVETQSPLAGVLIDALSSASSPECESALIGLYSSPDPQIQRRARFAMTRLVRPGASAVAAMKARLATLPFDEGALYAIGSYASRFSESGDSGGAAELGDYLLQRLATATDGSDKITVLRSIENSGHAASVPVLGRYFKDRDPFVRRAAIRALRPMRAPEVDELLASEVESASTDADDRVIALDVAKARGFSQVVVPAVVAAAGADELRVRHPAIALLAEWLPRQPSVRSALEKASKSDPDSRVRAIARAAL